MRTEPFLKRRQGLALSSLKLVSSRCGEEGALYRKVAPDNSYPSSSWPCVGLRLQLADLTDLLASEKYVDTPSPLLAIKRSYQDFQFSLLRLFVCFSRLVDTTLRMNAVG